MLRLKSKFYGRRALFEERIHLLGKTSTRSRTRRDTRGVSDIAKIVKSGWQNGLHGRAVRLLPGRSNGQSVYVRAHCCPGELVRSRSRPSKPTESFNSFPPHIQDRDLYPACVVVFCLTCVVPFRLASFCGTLAWNTPPSRRAAWFCSLGMVLVPFFDRPLLDRFTCCRAPSHTPYWPFSTP